MIYRKVKLHLNNERVASLLKMLGTITPVYLSYLRELRPNQPDKPISKIRKIFREVLILYPALFFMLNYPFTFYTLTFFLLFVSLYSLYEIGYIHNDYVRVKYDKEPTKRKYITHIHPRLSIALRLVYIITIGIVCRFLSLSYVLAVVILTIAILNHNLRTTKVDKVASLPFLRATKYIFIPLVISNFNLDIVLASLMLLLPLLIMDSEGYASTIIGFYETVRTSLDKPYYVWFLTFLPLQLLLLFKYSPYIFSGEIAFIIISMVRHK